MAKRSLFFDSVGDDRPHDAAAYAALLSALTIQDGVVYGYREGLAVAPLVGLTLQIKTGAAFILGRMLDVHTAAENLIIGTADATNPRIDRMVARLDLGAAARAITLAVKLGNPAAVPAPPALQRDGNVHEISLAQVRVNAGAVSIAAGDITDERSDSAVCGYTNYLLRVESDLNAGLSADHTRISRIEAVLSGHKSGLEIYYAGADDIRVRSGAIHVNDGVADYLVVKSGETQLSGESAIVGWKFITVDEAGNLTVRSATGTNAQRPTNAYFQWSGYNHSKRGYYYDANERIIGAVCRVSSSDWYTINCSEGGDEIGQNATGSWERVGNTQTVYGRVVAERAINTASGYMYTSPAIAVIWPAAFRAGESPKTSYTSVTTTYASLIYSQDAPTETGHDWIYLMRAISDASRSRTLDFIAIGKWR